MRCDFCQSSETTQVYNVSTSERGVVVSVCNNCGLVFSTARQKKNSKKRLVSTSSDADWGNVRHGKGIRLPKAIDVLAPILSKRNITNILDIGSNRGDFVLWIAANYPKIEVNAIEPDSHVVSDYIKQKRIKLQQSRFEEATLPSKRFDLIYCSHTLEHALSAREMIYAIYKSLKKGGYLFLEVPNIEIIGQNDIVEEFFIDKHTFHFNRKLLLDFLKQSGFSVISGEKDADVSNITLLLKKENNMQVFVPKDKKLAVYNKKLISLYQSLLKNNKAKIKKVADKLYAFMKRQKVVLWGGGRIFDALVKYGDLKMDEATLLIDDYLSKYLSEVHGIKLNNSSVLRIVNPDVVIILAKNSTEEIYQQAKRFGIRHVFRFSDLLNE